jgi:mRNA interferase MazF
MATRRRVPDRGDIVWLDFNPQAGHEQSGRRPALVLSPREYNRKVGLALVCPITSQAKGYPFEVAVQAKRTTGVVLADQVKSLDWQKRRASIEDRISADALEDVVAKAMALIDLRPIA